MRHLFPTLVDTDLEPLILASHSYYGQNASDRKYHNLFHAHSVVSSINILTNNKTSPALALAGLWHDAVYIPHVGGDVNERASARALEIEFNRHVGDNEYEQEIEDAARMIVHSDISTHLHTDRIDDELAFLLDADLSSLAAPWDNFVKNQINIIHENGGSVPRDYDKSASFLKMFLWKREFIYHTDAARSLWEYTARTNITQYCRLHNVDLNT